MRDKGFRDRLKSRETLMTKLKVYNRVARLYNILDLPFEYLRYRPIRKILFNGLTGPLLDAGVGTGCNIPYYPEDAAVTGIDHSPAMLERASIQKAKLKSDVHLAEMDVMKLEFSEDSFDNIVSTFLFCVLDAEHQQPALEELRRVCRPDGKIYILEYALSENPIRRFSMKLWAPWVRYFYGADFDRRTEQYLESAGLELVEKEFLYKDVIKLLTIQPRAL